MVSPNVRAMVLNWAWIVIDWKLKHNHVLYLKLNNLWDELNIKVEPCVIKRSDVQINVSCYGLKLIVMWNEIVHIGGWHHLIIGMPINDDSTTPYFPHMVGMHPSIHVAKH